MKLNLFPKFEAEPKMGFHSVTKIDNPFLQALADAGALVVVTSKEDYWVIACNAMLLFKIREEDMHLECISVPDIHRRQGEGSKAMKIMTQLSDETGVPITLRVSNVTGNGWMMMQHPVIAMGMAKKNKIPVGSLPKWYEKFGFERTPDFSPKEKNMIYKPKIKA
ncbi:MAG: hypothetical protein AABY15_06625 [Nanoarchaeota archaeon]